MHCVPSTSFVHNGFSNLCLGSTQLHENFYPDIRHLEQGYMLLPPASKNALQIASIDCEFCKTTQGLEVLRVIVVNQRLEVVINEMVKPKGKIVDLLTDVHRIEPWEASQARLSLLDIQEKLYSLCDQNTVLVGHDLNCDLKGLRIVHFRCADTKVLFNPQKRKNLNLRMLSKAILKKPIIEPADYPRTTMELCLLLLESRSRQTLPQRSFGSKQELITRIHTKLLAKYQNRLVVPVSTCLRGKDTIRIHVKKWNQLMHIEGMLDQLDRMAGFVQICLPISMKTKSQKKGFFVYLKFASHFDVDPVLSHIRQSQLFKAEIAESRGTNNHHKKIQLIQLPHGFLRTVDPCKYFNPLFRGKCSDLFLPPSHLCSPLFSD